MARRRVRPRKRGARILHQDELQTFSSVLCLNLCALLGTYVLHYMRRRLLEPHSADSLVSLLHLSMPADYSTASFHSRRSPVFSTEGIAASSQSLASEAGLSILRAGGNAADAGVAMAAMLNVTEPCNCGIGGDVFAL